MCMYVTSKVYATTNFNINYENVARKCHLNTPSYAKTCNICAAIEMQFNWWLVSIKLFKIQVTHSINDLYRCAKQLLCNNIIKPYHYPDFEMWQQMRNYWINNNKIVVNNFVLNHAESKWNFQRFSRYFFPTLTIKVIESLKQSLCFVNKIV